MAMPGSTRSLRRNRETGLCSGFKSGNGQIAAISYLFWRIAWCFRTEWSTRASDQMLTEMVDLHSGKVLESIKPLSVFPISEMQKAMRMMQSGKLIDKIIIDCTGDPVVQHTALQNTPLDFFIVLSSICGIVGNPGQSAYAASNAFFESFVSYRTRLGLLASTINISVVAEVGYAAEMNFAPAIAAAAQDHLSEAELLAVVKAAIIKPVVGCVYLQTVTGLRL
ncbi:MAG: hypothetical protein Q9192_000968 [Flavoplaca navasiana]